MLSRQHGLRVGLLREWVKQTAQHSHCSFDPAQAVRQLPAYPNPFNRRSCNVRLKLLSVLTGGRVLASMPHYCLVLHVIFSSQAHHLEAPISHKIRLNLCLLSAACDALICLWRPVLHSSFAHERVRKHAHLGKVALSFGHKDLKNNEGTLVQSVLVPKQLGIVQSRPATSWTCLY